MKRCVILVGHGGVPTDCPPALVSEFKRLEAAGKGKPSVRFSEVDRQLRRWPRSEKTDPYKSGLEAIAAVLRARFPDRLVLEAYNEFCAPSVEEALAEAVTQGCDRIMLISTMYTRGGVHSESEIPAIADAFQKSHPGVKVGYVWPYALDAVGDFLASEVNRSERLLENP